MRERLWSFETFGDKIFIIREYYSGKVLSSTRREGLKDPFMLDRCVCMCFCFVSMHVCMCVCVYVCMHVSMYVSMYVCMYVL